MLGGRHGKLWKAKPCSAAELKEAATHYPLATTSGHADANVSAVFQKPNFLSKLGSTNVIHTTTYRRGAAEPCSARACRPVHGDRTIFRTVSARPLTVGVGVWCCRREFSRRVARAGPARATWGLIVLRRAGPIPHGVHRAARPLCRRFGVAPRLHGAGLGFPGHDWRRRRVRRRAGVVGGTVGSLVVTWCRARHLATPCTG